MAVAAAASNRTGNAGSIAIIIPALVVIFLNRYLISGLLAGSAK